MWIEFCVGFVLDFDPDLDLDLDIISDPPVSKVIFILVVGTFVIYRLCMALELSAQLATVKVQADNIPIVRSYTIDKRCQSSKLPAQWAPVVVLAVESFAVYKMRLAFNLPANYRP
ncbi:hypothetical protein AVEN_24787-1 [Araneus ventricosus]|uniref:Uncharacterized protein n=1 Tax=Araneus ventricosus TaxID=182803 RepID=A0A4Y2RX89_ARAVE|nr:hypothetical protein AVEN_24787-1 [Araneus ventricosus]